MKKSLLTLAISFIATLAMGQIPAFPGAEGYGRYITGGRGGNIVHVSNLNDSGTGSLRAAVSGSAKKTIVFDVAGIIKLESDLVIGANTTIAGQTAPSPGITLRCYSVRPNGNNIIMRFIRVRRGEEENIHDGADACWAKNFTGIILDHCSFSWSIDEVSSFYDNCDFTMQWCSIGEGLANPGHSKGEHSYGGIWGGKGASFHHNMICHVQNRAPRLNGARYGWTGYNKTKYPGGTINAEQVDLRNNLMYNWGNGNGAYGAMGGYHNIVNNYYKAGPATKNKTRVFQCGKTSGKDADGGQAIDPEKKGIYGHFYISGNYVTAAGNDAESYDWKGVIVDGVNGIPDTIKLSSPISTFVNADVTTHSAQTAYEKILDYVGASLFRDNVDKRYVREANNGTTTYTGSASKTGEGESVTHYPGIIDFVKDQGEYTLASNMRSSSFDADKDGMADEWEQANGGDLNPNDYTLDHEHQWYTNLEVYMNSIVEDIVTAENAGAISAVNEYYPTCVKVDVNPQEDPSTGVTGTITWPFNTGVAGQTANVLPSISEGITSTSVTIGSDLDYDGTQSVASFKETKIKDLAYQSTAASEKNAITFTINIADGYKFQAENVEVTATRLGTDAGKLDISWIDDGGTISLIQGSTPKRNENKTGLEDQTPFYTAYSFNLSNDATASESTCKLIINMYGVTTSYKSGTTNLNYKDYGFCNIIITGQLISPTGISTPVTLSPALSTEYYNLAGQKVGSDAKGVVIVRQRMADGTIQTKKVMR